MRNYFLDFIQFFFRSVSRIFSDLPRSILISYIPYMRPRTPTHTLVCTFFFFRAGVPPWPGTHVGEIYSSARPLKSRPSTRSRTPFAQHHVHPRASPRNHHHHHHRRRRRFLSASSAPLIAFSSPARATGTCCWERQCIFYFQSRPH